MWVALPQEEQPAVSVVTQEGQLCVWDGAVSVMLEYLIFLMVSLILLTSEAKLSRCCLMFPIGSARAACWCLSVSAEG